MFLELSFSIGCCKVCLSLTLVIRLPDIQPMYFYLIESHFQFYLACTAFIRKKLIRLQGLHVSVLNNSRFIMYAIIVLYLKLKIQCFWNFLFRLQGLHVLCNTRCIIYALFIMIFTFRFLPRMHCFYTENSFMIKNQNSNDWEFFVFSCNECMSVSLAIPD